ncbi:phosphotransferase [Streptomyces sp. NBC_00464]|uniref:phosphotransferase family protein n=1 Tax=Streptomyces sp. NBC_00464 TaxID=2975751 RepID=UPI002E197ADE
MASLLGIFEERGFSGAPKYLGQVGGKDVLTYMEGHVPKKFQPWSDGQVRAATLLLREMHEATRGSRLAGRFDVVCHHDPGPNNYVFRNGLPVAIIDFEEAAPGSRLEDVAYLAWTWCISSKWATPLEEQADQVRLVADVYGLEEPERRALVDCVLERQARNVRFWSEFLARPASAPAPANVLGDRISWSRREHAFVCAHRDVFDRILN